MRIFVSLLATAIFVLAPSVACADGDLGNLLLIGDEDYGEETIAGAFRRLVDDGYFKVPRKELEKIDRLIVVAQGSVESQSETTT